MLYFCSKTFFLTFRNFDGQGYKFLPHFGSRNVIGHVAIRPAMRGFLWWPIDMTNHYLAWFPRY